MHLVYRTSAFRVGAGCKALLVVPPRMKSIDAVPPTTYHIDGIFAGQTSADFRSAVSFLFAFANTLKLSGNRLS
jgi:hypothetical protein